MEAVSSSIAMTLAAGLHLDDQRRTTGDVVPASRVTAMARRNAAVMRWTVKPVARRLVHRPVPVFHAYQQLMRGYQRLFLRGVDGLEHHGVTLHGGGLGGIPGVVFGDVTRTDAPVLLYLHGGGFFFPAIPEVHTAMVARLCRHLGAVGFLPDYRLAPRRTYPTALDDCERAYRAVLDAGFDASQVVLAGESAGGNLTLALLSRLRRRGLPYPACAVAISSVTDLTSVRTLRSRQDNRRVEPLIPRKGLARAIDVYPGGNDRLDPEVSPAYADFSGFPPLHLIAAADEIMLDDTRVVAERARAAGVETRVDLWPFLPHAFPLFGRLFPAETAGALADIITFARRHLPDGPLRALPV